MKIYRFYNIYLNEFSGELQENIWVQVAEHTQLVDAEVQLQRFIDSGIPIEQLKLVSDDSDPNAPQEEPQP